MKFVDWNALSGDERDAVLERPVARDVSDRRQRVRDIIQQVRTNGDDALRRYSLEFDGAMINRFQVNEAELYKASACLDAELGQAINSALAQLIRFHEATAPRPVQVETSPGVVCERVQRPIGRVGLYVPAGSAPLPSTVLMLGVPALLAGCKDVVLCCPPGAGGQVDATVLAAAERAGINQVFCIGGAQAIAAMAYGTESIPKCDKLFGPGNAWVTEAKLQVSIDPAGAAIDMPAGPSEVLVIADDSADPAFVAADLLSQAEHGPDSQVSLVTDDRALIDAVRQAIDEQLSGLSRVDVINAALEHALAICVADLETAVEVSNQYAPEHLIIQTRNPRRWLPDICAAGSVFLGPWSPESIGDYCSGTNHVLPTSGWARSFSGLSVSDFVTEMTVQELDREGLECLGPVAQALARAEGLTAHEQAVSIRLQSQYGAPA